MQSTRILGTVQVAAAKATALPSCLRKVLIDRKQRTTKKLSPRGSSLHIAQRKYSGGSRKAKSTFYIRQVPHVITRHGWPTSSIVIRSHALRGTL